MRKHSQVLCLAPHTDDAELGCGGTLARLVEEGVNVHVAAFSTAESSLPADMPKDTLRKEFFEAMPRLGIDVGNLFVYPFQVRQLSFHRQEVLERLIELRTTICPDLVLVPSRQDIHQDHAVLSNEGVRAFKNCTLLGYELPWNHLSFSTQAFVTLEHHHIERKWHAMQAYNSQLVLERPYFTKDFIEGLARVRGTQINVRWAEAFEVLRLKW